MTSSTIVHNSGLYFSDIGKMGEYADLLKDKIKNNDRFKAKFRERMNEIKGK